MTPAELRAQLLDAGVTICEWPRCEERAVELAHLHSTGMGGRVSAHTLANVAMMCFDHARISDGGYGSGGAPQYLEAHRVLFDRVPVLRPQKPGRLTWPRAEAMTEVVRRERGWMETGNSIV